MLTEKKAIAQVKATKKDIRVLNVEIPEKTRSKLRFLAFKFDRSIKSLTKEAFDNFFASPEIKRELKNYNGQ